MKLFILVIMMLILTSCNDKPIEVTVKMDIPRDTVVVNTIVHDTIYLTKGSLKHSPYAQAVLALSSLNDSLYRLAYDTYEYNKFPHKCNEGNIKLYRFARMHYTNDKSISREFSLTHPETLPIKSYKFAKDSAVVIDGMYGDVNDNTLECTIIENGMITKAWDITKNGITKHY